MPVVTRSKRKRSSIAKREEKQDTLKINACEGNSLAYDTAKAAWKERLKEMLQRGRMSTAENTLSICKKCKSAQNITFHLVQTRSSDEASTIFLVCSACNSKWRL